LRLIYMLEHDRCGGNHSLFEGGELGVGHVAEPFRDRIGRKMQIQRLRWAGDYLLPLQLIAAGGEWTVGKVGARICAPKKNSVFARPDERQTIFIVTGKAERPFGD
jgi:hypothetical protein